MRVLILLLFFPSISGSIDLVKVDKSERKMYLIEKGGIVKAYTVLLGGSAKINGRIAK